MSIREDLATAIAAQLAVEPVWDGLEVYATPDDVTQVPAVVLVPANPWAAPATMGRNSPGATVWAFNVQLMVLRADPESALDLLEQLYFDVTLGAGTLGASTRGMSAPEQIQAAGIPVLVAELSIELMTTRKV